jgi:hydrogenase/urease accessory protein HupE
LQGLLLQLSPDEHPASEARHLVVMGRFAVEGQTQDLQLHLSLFGTHPEEKTQSILVSQGERTHRLVLSASQPNGWLLPSAGRTVVNHAREGFTHVLNGPDHLLFLLVVLAAGGGWRRMVWTLTSFTIGHAVTLTASVLWDLKLPSSVVEPAIAATILGMAAFDRWLVNHRGRVWSPSLRLGLVFGCALVHGLGLAGALADLELNTEQRLLSLLGFNLGIELAQVAVAFAAAVAMNTAVRWWGRAGPATLRQATTVTAWLAGSVWLVLRMTNGG